MANFPNKLDIPIPPGPLALLSITGTDNIVSASLPAGFTALTDLLVFVFESVGANAGPVTLNIGDGIARAVTHIGGAALVAGDIPGPDTLVECFYDISNNTFHAQLIRQPYTTAATKLSGTAGAGSSTRYSRGDHQHGSAIVGVIDGSNAAAGDIDEIISSTVPFASAIPLTNAVAANVTSISLMPGRWNISGMVGFVSTTTTTSGNQQCGINNISATLPAPDKLSYFSMQGAGITGIGMGLNISTNYFSISVPTTFFLIAYGTFSGGTLGAYGSIVAERI